MFGFLKRFLGDNNDKEIKRMQKVVEGDVSKLHGRQTYGND